MRKVEDPRTGKYMVRFSVPDKGELSVGEKPGKFILKVQMPVDVPESAPALVYDRSKQYEGYVPQRDVASVMQGRSKVYFYATVRSDGVVQLDEEAPFQPW